ncbi:MAG: DNA replication/repair protein RecF, partial [Candidatus Thiodiazotropha sp.]
LNFIYGDNGAGKSSILEGIYLLARSRSFRNTHTRSLIQQGSNEVILFTEVVAETGQVNKIGVRKQGSRTEIKLNGRQLDRLSDLVTTLTVSLVTPQTHRIIEEGPEYRRRLLNWGVFHVEHQFRQTVTNYNRILAQRNAALKAKQTKVEIWDEQLSQYAEKIVHQHQEYMINWFELIEALSSGISFLENLQLQYQTGWDSKFRLIDQLKLKLSLDRGRGFTSVGPHRSDLQIKIDNRPAKEVLSRGQQKLLMILMMLAQSKLMTQSVGERAIFLIDDFHSELDKGSQNRVIEQLIDEQCQAVITSIDNSLVTGSDRAFEAEMFHVEQGAVQKID